jgi:GrpB-like predicted nucleotidyltransferase (UPF0157 family)
MNTPKIAPVVLREYDPTWPDKFLKERSILTDIIGEHVLSIEHIGSTSVEGMLAKPEIDILVGIARIDDAKPLISILAEAGYPYYRRFEEFVPERRYFRKSKGIVPLVHIHMVESTSDFYNEHILFRDALRTDPELRKRYIALKKSLLEESGGDRLKYNKVDFIREEIDRIKRGSAEKK